ncbi:3' exoribonuclease family, domain 1-domain-containing protein [Clohesyomyces aquaticus]|uniref:3' exoribonuclease family, domain 1-domain-containing protein n=1 Tax=Clohesyomyces aquaticus TaxID=1231657 RepID=A0A1Y2A906_9PLEO|nr:3' exoribonuclease family, domain 1-domain-containing protein [Clohesyomyces aquaticus]
MNSDRRRINAPAGGTSAPVFARTLKEPGHLQSLRPLRARAPDELRNIFVQTGVVPSASGSAYLEVPSAPSSVAASSLIPPSSSLKISCSVQGPKPLPRSAPFSPSLLLTTTIKFAPFASRTRRGYIRDSVERDLGVHLETALRGVIIGERWPKSGVEVIVTVIEGDEDAWWGEGITGANGAGNGSRWGLLNVLAGCITVSSAAIADAGIDCVDLVSGGVAAMVRNPRDKGGVIRVLDPCPSEHEEILAGCVVGYLAARDEVTEVWMKGDLGSSLEELVEGATHAAVGSLSVLKEVLLESVEGKLKGQAGGLQRRTTQQDVEMVG